MAKAKPRVRSEQFVFLPTKEQAKVVHEIVSQHQGRFSQGAVLRELLQRGVEDYLAGRGSFTR